MTRVTQTIFWFGLIIVASLVLYHTSDRVHVLDQELHGLNADIETEQKTMHVLKAEWVYLANPARLEASAHKFLALRPTAPRQVVKLDDLAEALAAHHDVTAAAAPTTERAVAANVSVTPTPMASLRTTLAALPPRMVAAVRNAHSKLGTMAVASADTTRINDRMVMERTASATQLGEPGTDPIGNLIASSGPRQ